MLELHHEDCLAGMKQLSSECVDLVVTSPPYNLGINYGTYQDKLECNDFIDWCQEWASEIHRVMKDEASFFLNLGGSAKRSTSPAPTRPRPHPERAKLHPPKYLSVDQVD